MTALDLTGQVLDHVRATAGDAEAEVGIDDTTVALTRFANSYIHQNVAERSVQVRLRLHRAGRTASGTTTATDPAGLRALVERTAAAASVCPTDPGWPGLGGPTPLTRPGVADAATAQADPAERARRVADFVAAVGGLEAAGYCRTLARTSAYANSAGHAVEASTAEASMDGVARNRGADGVGRLAVTRLADLDGAVLGERAAAKARAGIDPIELPPGRYEVVLEPTAAIDLLQNMAYVGFNGRAVIDKQSFLRLGERQFDEAISITDFAPGAPGIPFDADGTPRMALRLVTAGVTTAIAHDRRTAAEAGVESTGRALGAGAPPVPLDLAMAAGSGASGAVVGPVDSGATAALVRGVDRGLLVTDLWYTRILDPKSLVVTGLTRNGVWLIEGGEIAGPVRNFRFTQSYSQALAPGAVRAVGSEVRMIQDSWAHSWWSAPALHLASWNFTGGASG
jgi:predicted Zn-dependent protease